MFLKISLNKQVYTWVGVSFLIKLQASRYSNGGDFNAGVFLEFRENFKSTFLNTSGRLLLYFSKIPNLYALWADNPQDIFAKGFLYMVFCILQIYLGFLVLLKMEYFHQCFCTCKNHVEWNQS